MNEDEGLFLFGLRIVVRPGKGYYDFLRALDWFLLKSYNKKTDFETIIGWIKKHITDFDQEEVRQVFALRCIGILGWDMLHRGDEGEGDIKSKKKLLLKLIKRDYNI